MKTTMIFHTQNSTLKKDNFVTISTLIIHSLQLRFRIFYAFRIQMNCIMQIRKGDKGEQTRAGTYLKIECILRTILTNVSNGVMYKNI